MNVGDAFKCLKQLDAEVLHRLLHIPAREREDILVGGVGFASSASFWAAVECSRSTWAVLPTFTLPATFRAVLGGAALGLAALTLGLAAFARGVLAASEGGWVVAEAVVVGRVP